jgi:hypothetical protein
MQRLLFVVFGQVHRCELGSDAQELSDEGDVAGLDGLDQAADRDPAHVCLELRPAWIPVGAGQDELRLVKGKRRAIGVAEVCGDFSDRCGIAAPEGVEEILRLVAELSEVGAVGERACGNGHQ